jgi:hypothetical protein
MQTASPPPNSVQNQVSIDNWTFTHFISQDLKAFIALGGEMKQDQVEILYNVTVLGDENKEVFVKSFQELEQAILFINQRYGHWSTLDGRVAAQGCGTCSAH